MSRQIPFLHKRKCSDYYAWHWKPSPRLRKSGWTNRLLGTTKAARPTAEITAKALELNEQLEQWERGALEVAHAAKTPRSYNFGDLVDAYKASEEFTSCKPATQAEYSTRLRQLTQWADDGRMMIRAIDKASVRDLKTALTQTGKSKHKISALMRVLRLLMNWAISYELLETNPTDKVAIPSAPARETIVLPDQSERAAEAAVALGFPAVGLGFRIALLSLQRESDLLALNRLSWRELENVDPADAAVLANSDGRVMGFRLRQQKTGAWIDAPMPPHLHGEIERAFARSQWLLPDDNKPERACPEYLFQRRARKALNAAGLDEFQFRDWRRGGMCMYRDLGVGDSLITAISGHAVLGRKTILDTYMPPNTRAACAAVAMMLRALARREKKSDAK